MSLKSVTCLANEPSEPTEAFQGQVFQWSLPGSAAIPPNYRLEPASHGLLHVEFQGPSVTITLVATQAGPLLVRDHQSKVIRRFNIKPWPNRPPSGGITAGAGEFSGKWQPIAVQPQAGEALSLDLYVEGEACLAILETPKINVQTETGPQSPTFIQSETGWPDPDKKPYRVWHYEWTNTQAGPGRVGPLLFHFLDPNTGKIQTKLIAGPSWTTAPRELYQAPAQPAPAEKKPRHLGRIILFILTAGNLLATILVIFRHNLVLCFLNLRLKQNRPPLSQEKALSLYRRYEPIIADIERARPKKQTANLSQVRQRLRAVEDIAFGRPVDQKPIR